MRKIILSLLIAALLLCAAGFAEGPVLAPIVSMEVVPLDDSTPAPTQEPAPEPTATPAPEPTATPAPEPTEVEVLVTEVKEVAVSASEAGTLMADSKPATLSVGGLFGSGMTVLGSDVPRASITAVRFEPTAVGAPADAWDVSAEQNGSVLAWIKDGALTIAGQGGVRANADSSYLFAGYSAATEIDFNGCFFTEEATDMSYMFEGCASLTALNVSALNTSDVTDMSYMFSSCVSLVSLNVRGIDTSAVTSMEGMFFMDAQLEELDVAGFNTSAAASMRSMFESCAALKSLDLSGFDISAVKDMSWMFSGCAALAQISVSADFASAKNADDMLSGCAATLNVVDVESAAESQADSEKETVEEIEEESKADKPSKQSVYAGLKLWSRGDEVERIQKKLNELGYYRGYFDGVLGPDTQKAIKAWQKDRGFEANGAIDAEQAEELFK